MAGAAALAEDTAVAVSVADTMAAALVADGPVDFMGLILAPDPAVFTVHQWAAGILDTGGLIVAAVAVVEA